MLAVNLYARVLAWNSLELAGAVPQQNQAAAGVLPRHFRGDVEEILAKEKIFMAIPVEIGNCDGEDGSELGFARELDGLKATSTV